MIRQTIHKYTLTLVFIFLTVALNCFGQSRCAELFSRTKDSSGRNLTIEALKAYGFSQQVATRIENDLPDLAANIIRLPKSKGGAITLYKGINRPPNEITLDLSLYQRSEIWFSLDLDTARSFARTEKPEVGTIIEVQVPISFFSSADPSIKDPKVLEKRGLYDGTLSKYDIPNLQPFVKRIGAYGVESNTEENGINWVTFEEATNSGFFRARFNYKKYFLPR